MKKVVVSAICMGLACSAFAETKDVKKESPKELRVAVAGEPREIGSTATVEYLTLKEPLAKATGLPVKIISKANLGELARGTRTGEYDVMWVPSHLAGSALKHGFSVAGSDGKSEKFSIVVRNEIAGFPDLVGKTLYMPQEDSLATYVGTALLSANNTELTKFKKVFTRSGTYEVAMYAIASGTSDAAVVEETVAKEWIQKNPGKARILATSRSVPGQTLVFKKTLPDDVQTKLVGWFNKPNVSAVKLPNGFSAGGGEAYSYVVGLGHYTPTVLDGVKMVASREVADLIKQGVTMVDVRSADEFKTKRIAAATHLSYKEASPKTVDFNPTLDEFAIEKLEPNKSYIFACNGPECWKSYKASKLAALSKRFKNVYWFRGGLPEWESLSLPMVRGI